MDALIFVFGGLCFLGLALLCGADLTIRLNKEIQQNRKEIAEGLLEPQRIQEKIDREKKQLDELLKTKEREV